MEPPDGQCSFSSQGNPPNKHCQIKYLEGGVFCFWIPKIECVTLMGDPSKTLVAQWAKHLPYKCGDLCLTPNTHREVEGEKQCHEVFL